MAIREATNMEAPVRMFGLVPELNDECLGTWTSAPSHIGI